MALIKPMAVGLSLVASSPSLPSIDYKRTCRDVSEKDGFQKCVDDELYARRKLLKYWSRTPSNYKSQCVPDPMPPYPSYTVLRDCINNYVILDEARSRRKGVPDPIGSARSSGSGGGAGSPLGR